jgi:hypothetical protein
LVECYHDRIREAVVRAIEKPRLGAVNLRLAEALAGAPEPDPAQVALHFREAGDRARGAAWTRRAAELAAASLAFDDAVRLFALARTLSDGPPDDELEIAYAEALTAAGRGAEAGRTFLAVAPRLDEKRRIDLSRRAAEELLVAGHLDEGTAAIAGVLRELGLRAPPRSRAGAVTRVLAGRARRAIGGMGFTERKAAEIPERELLAIDAIGGFAFAMWSMDPLVGAALQSDHLRLALRGGEPSRLSLALLLEASVSGITGSRATKRTHQLLDRARELSRAAPAELEPILLTVEGGLAILEGRWKDSYDALGEAERRWGAAALGHSSARQQARVLRVLATFWRGRSGEALRVIPPLLRDLEERGNFLGWVWIQLLEGWALAFTGRLFAARETSSRVRDRLPATGFELQHWWMAFADAHYDLFAKDPAAAWRRLEDGALERGFLGQVQKIAARWLRARAALGCAALSVGDRREMLSEARADAKKIEKEDAAWGTALAISLRGSAAWIEGDLDSATALFADAEPRLDEHAFESVAAAVREARGAILGGDEGRALAEKGRAWRASQRAIDDATWVQIPCPPK